MQTEEEIPVMLDEELDALVVRQTPARKVRERWALNRLRHRQIELERDLEAFHHAENYDYNLEGVEPLPAKIIPQYVSWYQELTANIQRFLCKTVHRDPEYKPGNLYSQCECGRKYQVPWVRPEDVPADVEMLPPFIMPTERTQQTEGRGWTGRVL